MSAPSVAESSNQSIDKGARHGVVIGLARQTSHFARSLEKFHREQARIAGLTNTEFRALTVISDIGEITPKTLAAELEMTTGAVTALSDKLIMSGHITRAAHPRDRRSVILDLSDEGRATMNRNYAEYVAKVDELTKGTKTSALHELATLLGGISRSIDDSQ